MTSHTLTLAALSDASPANDRIPFHRLVAIELRKTVNSRGAFWFAITIPAAMIALMIGSVLGGEQVDQTVTTYFSNGAQLIDVLLPIVALLLVSAEWTQRSAMTTLAQQPRRTELLLTKLTASMILGLVALAACIAAAFAIGVVAANDSSGSMSLNWEIVGQTSLMVLLSVARGFAFGAAFLRSAPAIVGYMLLPAIVLILGTFGAIQSAIQWIDLGAASAPVTEQVMNVTEWKYFLVSAIAWVSVPLVVGWWRVTRSEVG